jgi:hypothetical protein
MVIGYFSTVISAIAVFGFGHSPVLIALPSQIPSLEELHNLGLKCLRQSKSPYGYHEIPFHTRSERLSEFRRVWNLTRLFRTYPIYEWLGYSGPWTEDIWIAEFSHVNFDDYGPYVPIFLPWVNTYKYHNRSRTDRSYPPVIAEFFAQLKPDFLYITVNANDYGVEGMRCVNPVIPPNLLIISPSGRGHIPILYHFKPQNLTTALPPNNTIIFLGNMKRPGRRRILQRYSQAFRGRITIARKVPDWIDAYRRHKLILSPLGNARGAFRTSEILQMGLIPIIAFEREKWIPYLHSSLPWKDIGFHTTHADLPDFVKVVGQLTDRRLRQMRATVRKFRDTHFTMEATMRQIGLFMKYGYAGSDLRCDRFYPGT